mmetsp:Transcript_24435/g.56289  ORF Transcript_24435/g.56289 Transcript_24435/m.56289 type:complete len:325 (+) Transcript_24435:26-1000(+)
MVTLPRSVLERTLIACLALLTAVVCNDFCYCAARSQALRLHHPRGGSARSSRRLTATTLRRANANERADEIADLKTATSRRTPVSAAAGLCVGALGAALSVRAAGEPKITAKVAFDLESKQTRSTLGKQARELKRIVIGVFEEEAPVLTRNFMQAATRTYPGKGGRQVYYKGGSIKGLEPGKSVSFADFADGNLRLIVTQVESAGGTGAFVGTQTAYVPLPEEDTLTNEENSLRHDKFGRVSMKKGGGTFDFQIAPAAEAPWLDKTNVVIGQVVEGLDVLEELNQSPTFRGKPNFKVKVVEATVLEATNKTWLETETKKTETKK